MRSKFLHLSTLFDQTAKLRRRNPLNEVKVSTTLPELCLWRDAVAIPFKWGQVLPYGIDKNNKSQSLLNEVKVSTQPYCIYSCQPSSQSLLNEVKVSTLRLATSNLTKTRRNHEVSFYFEICASNKDIKMSQSLLNEVKVSTWDSNIFSP